MIVGDGRMAIQIKRPHGLSIVKRLAGVLMSNHDGALESEAFRVLFLEFCTLTR